MTKRDGYGLYTVCPACGQSHRVTYSQFDTEKDVIICCPNLIFGKICDYEFRVIQPPAVDLVFGMVHES